MATRELRAGLLVLSLFASAGCAHSGGASSSDAAAISDVATPPRIRGSPTIMVMPGRFSGTIELPVDASGRPDIAALRFVGRASDDVRRELASWLGQVTFDPATRGGVPVPGVFKMRIRVR